MTVGEPADPTPASSPSGAPGSTIFSLDRPGAGLYAAAWFFAFASIALLGIGILADSPTARAVLVLGGFLALVACFGAAGGYQVIARAGRPPGAYRGPSPLIAFGLAVGLSSVLAVVLDVVPILALTSAPGFLLALAFVLVGYLLTITLLVVRTGALAWPDLLRLAAQPRRRVIDFVAGAVSGLVVVLPLAVLGGLLASAVGVSASAGDRLPDLSTAPSAMVVALGVVLVAPLGEELFFRGFAQSAWWADLGAGRALRRSAVFFAFVHVFNATGVTFRDAAGGALVQFVVILPLAFLLGLLYERRGLAGSLGAHMAYNAGVLGLALVAGGALHP